MEKEAYGKKKEMIDGMRVYIVRKACTKGVPLVILGVLPGRKTAYSTKIADIYVLPTRSTCLRLLWARVVRSMCARTKKIYICIYMMNKIEKKGDTKAGEARAKGNPNALSRS